MNDSNEPGRNPFAERFEDLRIWQEARALVGEVYRSFARCSYLAFRDQIQRAALSVMNNRTISRKDLNEGRAKTSRISWIWRKVRPAKCGA